MRLNSILPLSPTDIYKFIRKNKDEDLPLMVHYWKLALLEYYPTEKSLYEYLLDYGNDQFETKGLIEGLLGSEFLRNIYSEKDPLVVILKSHLLLDGFIDSIMKRKKINTKKLSFYSKIEMLNKQDLLQEDIYNDLLIVNKLRNEYAHNYYFDISSFDMSSFSICRGLYDGLPIRKKVTKGILNVKVFQFYILYNLLGRMSYDFPFLNNLKIKKMPNKIFFEEEIGDIMGKTISSIHRKIKNSNLDFSVSLKIVEKNKSKK